MFHGDVRVQTVPVLVCFSTGGAGVLDSLDVRLNMLLHVSSRLPASLRLSTNSAHPRSVPLSAREYVVWCTLKMLYGEGLINSFDLTW